METAKISANSPLQWRPPDDKPDEDFTLLELWSRFYDEIAEYQGFCNKEKTTGEYTAALRIIEEALKKHKAAQMTAADCLEAVKSVDTYERDGRIVEYKEASYGKRWSAIRDIFRYCEQRFICADPLWKAPWELLKVRQRDVWEKSKEDILEELRKAMTQRSLKLQYITPNMERQIVQKAVSNLLGPAGQRDGRWMGMLCYLYLGVRPSEGRGLLFQDFKPFQSHPEHWYCDICRTATAAGELTAKGKNRNYIRRIPVHPELQTILEAYKRLLMAELKCSETELNAMPLICVGAASRKPCTTLQLMRFIKSQLGSIFDADELDALFALTYTTPSDVDEPANTFESSADEAANRDFSTRIFRRNFITKIYSETPLNEDEIRAIVGHRQIAARLDYSEETVYAWFQALSHRLICPEYHTQIVSIVDGRAAPQQTTAGLHDVMIRKEAAADGLRIRISMIADAAGGDLLAAVRGALPEGVTVTCEQVFYAQEHGRQGRIITDAAHWLL